MKIKHFLVLALLFTKLVATTSVDSQIAAWEDVWTTARSIAGFSWKETHVPGLIDRVAYVANYVKDAIWGDTEREAVISTVMQKAGVLEASSSLTFQQAFRCINVLATTCDKTLPTVPLETVSNELPKSWLEMKVRQTNSEYFDKYMLNFSDKFSLCVPKGGLKISRFVDGFLRERPYQLSALANQSIPGGGVHGGHYREVKESYEHDDSHAALFMTNTKFDPSGYMGDRFFQHFWPGYEKVKTVRDRLDPKSREKKIIDTFLFIFFHEAYAYFGKEHQERDITNMPFNDFIDAMKEVCDSYREKDFTKLPIDPYGMLGDTTESVSSDLGNSESCYLKDVRGAWQDIRSLGELPADGKISFDDTLYWHSIILEKECNITINDIRKDDIEGYIVVKETGKEYVFSEMMGPQYLVKHKAQDSLKLLKSAEYDLGDIVRATIFNVDSINRLVSRLFEDATLILKTQWAAMQTGDAR